ncbi:MAG: sugar kinase [Enterobacter sp.]|nr:sugar kinase [Enterobacter sp.]
MHKTLDVITIGEAMAMFVATETGELSAVEHFIKRVAGAELNVATGLARLGLNVGWVSRVGDDSFGHFVLDSLKKEGIDAAGVTLDGRFPTGFQLKSKVENGTDPIATTMKAQGKTLSFDPNLRPVLWKSEAEMVEKLNRLAFRADWVLPGLKEGMILTGESTPEGIADFYLNKGVKAVVLKTGADGAWFKTANGEQGAVAAVKVENVVDTVGAGDGFAVGVISALLEGKTLPQAVARGNKIGSLAIQVQGDSEGLPTRAQLGV